jgi:hypothetical protein
VRRAVLREILWCESEWDGHGADRARVGRRSRHRPVYLVLCLAAAVRQVAGYSLGAYFPSFFRQSFQLSDREYADTMVVVGVIVATAGTAGALLGTALPCQANSREAGGGRQSWGVGERRWGGGLCRQHAAERCGTRCGAGGALSDWLQRSSASAKLDVIAVSQVKEGGVEGSLGAGAGAFTSHALW